MRRFFRDRFDAWLDRRLPPVPGLVLNHRSIFIFPGREGLVFAVVLILTFVAAVNYQNSLGHVLAFFLLALGHLAIHQTYRNLSGLSLRLGHAQPVFVGEAAEFPIILESDSGRDYRSLALGFGGREEAWTDVLPGSASVLRLPLPARRRGYLRPERVYLATYYPLGILRAWSWLAFEGYCLVYPKPLPPPETPGRGAGAESTAGRQEQLGSEDYAGMDRHQPGESLRRVDWKAFARERGMHNKRFIEPNGSLQELDFEAFTGVDTELRLSFLCYLVLKAESEGMRYALRLPGEAIPSGLGAGHRERCLRALALFGKEAGGHA
ncbi:MAG: DUF58 domain-containing protein [Gammaproteobacteria bacterium]|nr:DUF58 domain-containing protein [Gammaproteobacteria bacterium]